MKILPVLLLLSLTVLPSQAATILYDAGTPSGNSTSGSDPVINQILADDFSLVGNSLVTQVVWWGGYMYDTPLTNDFIINTYSDDGGLPGVFISSDAVAATRVPDGATTGVPGAGPLYDVYRYTADLPGTALAGSTVYWLSIFSNTGSFNDQWFWAHGDQIPPYAFFRNDVWAIAPFVSLPFQLVGTQVPEPAPWLLSAAGLAGIFALRQRNRAAQ